MPTETPGDTQLDEFLPLREEDHIYGSKDAGLILVEFGDYECPACAEAYWVIERIEKDMGEDLCFVFRHYAYARVHPHAELAAQAAEAAGAQGKFWEMHRALFADQQHLEFEDLIARAERLELDVERVREELKTEKYLERVREDFRTGVQNGVFGTPTLFINGIRHNSAIDYETLTEALNKAKQATPAE
jgi:protein-disulfide isomerase